MRRLDDKHASRAWGDTREHRILDEMGTRAWGDRDTPLFRSTAGAQSEGAPPSVDRPPTIATIRAELKRDPALLVSGDARTSACVRVTPRTCPFLGELTSALGIPGRDVVIYFAPPRALAVPDTFPLRREGAGEQVAHVTWLTRGVRRRVMYGVIESVSDA